MLPACSRSSFLPALRHCTTSAEHSSSAVVSRSQRLLQSPKRLLACPCPMPSSCPRPRPRPHSRPCPPPCPHQCQCPRPCRSARPVMWLCRVVSCRVVSCRVVSCRVVVWSVWCGVVWCGVALCCVVCCVLCCLQKPKTNQTATKPKSVSKHPSKQPAARSKQHAQ